MDMTKYATKQYLSVETVQNEQIFNLKLLNAGSNTTGMFGDQAVFEVEYNDTEYLFTPNGESVSNLIENLGVESKKWIGKEIDIQIKKNKNDKFIIVCLGEKSVEEQKVE